MSGRAANRGNVGYSARKIESEEFRLTFRVEQIVQNIALSVGSRAIEALAVHNPTKVGYSSSMDSV
jgi:hypothetical protein